MGRPPEPGASAERSTTLCEAGGVGPQVHADVGEVTP